MKIESETKHSKIHFDRTSQLLIIALTMALSEFLRRLLEPINCPINGAENNYVSHVRRLAYRHLPDELLDVVEAVRAGAISPTAVVVKGLPYDPIAWAPAPNESPRDRKPTDLSENLLVMLASLFGEPYGILGEGRHFVNNLIPTRSASRTFTGNGAEVDLDFHIENAVHRLRRDADLAPLALMLEGLAAPPDGPLTSVSNGRLAAARLTPEDYSILTEPIARIALPLRQRVPGIPIRSEPSPILTGARGAETITAALYSDLTEVTGGRAARALANFKAAIDAAAVGTRITPGTLLYVPNTYTLHKRDKFTPRYDDQGRAQRWLQRVFITSRLDAFRVGLTPDSERVFQLPAPWPTEPRFAA
jgi:L-asparagine oxygenase